jgi:hypothetical protein
MWYTFSAVLRVLAISTFLADHILACSVLAIVVTGYAVAPVALGSIFFSAERHDVIVVAHVPDGGCSKRIYSCR